ncbi:NYN domain-containing protein [Frigoriglobus tundricola]|uniref:NYN domain-containing protein n=1 Tax=Frigoriglobus tundricola TaxID=2774151 RepID=A0A6M5YYP4_9BACT|nr:NYN domain-containing protein [Frigoriglobus tundricola]QJW98978.1 hypothetical protein FTUN_6573 [Frigoriglobus tundricola]
MKPSAVLLIDLENFFLSRVQHFDSKAVPPSGRPAFAKDFEHLIAFAQRMAGAPFAVRRAYADYVTLRVGPRELMRQGVEPVQVFRLSGARSGSKNAADMRMAMDATALLASAGHAEHFVLVTGDADFIPVILELKRHGRAVSVIGVTGATNELIQRFVDNFELFEDLLAAEEVEVRSGELALVGDGMEKVAGAVRRLLSRNRPLRFAAVKPLLSKELDAPFDPGVFGCDTTGDFLRQYATELGIVIRQGQHDSEIDLPGVTPNGTGFKASARLPSKPAAQALPEQQTGARLPTAEYHTAAHYRQLFAGRGATGGGAVKVPPVSWAVLAWSCDAVVELLAPPAGEPTHTTSLLPKLLKAADGATIPDLVKHLRLFYPTLRAGLPVQGADGVYSLPADCTGEQIRLSVLSYIGHVLNCRLSESGVAGAICSDALAAVFEPGPAIEQVTAEVTTALARSDARLPEPSQPSRPLPPGAEEVHTPASYLKLLKAGGPKSSETESLKVLPVPWPSVERACEDAFSLLHPNAGGGPLPRDELNARLSAAGTDLFIEQYPQHVRRVLGILRVAGDVTEENGTVALAPDIATAQELRNRTLAFLLQLLQLRLEERDHFDPIRPPAFVAAIEGGPFTDRLLEEVMPAIAWLYRPDTAGDSGTAGPDPFPVSERSEVEPDKVPLAAPDRDVIDLREADDGATPRPEPGWSPGSDDAVPEAAEMSPAAPPDPPSAVFGVVDVAVITSEAVAAAAEPQRAAGAEVNGPPADHRGHAAPTEPDPMPFAALTARAPETEPEHPPQDPFSAVPVADWLPDGDPLFSDPGSAPRGEPALDAVSPPVAPRRPPFAKIGSPSPSPPPEPA